MPDQPRPWLPTTKTQSALVFGLNALLLVNLSVIVVLLSAPELLVGSQVGEDALASDAAVLEQVDEPADDALVQGPASPEPVVTPERELEPVVKLTPKPAAEPAPVANIQQPAAAPAEDVAVVTTVNAEPQPEEPAIEFFGVGVE